MSLLYRQNEIFSISQPYRPPRPVTGIALLYFYLLGGWVGCQGIVVAKRIILFPLSGYVSILGHGSHLAHYFIPYAV
jgi:hypothetical protein